MTKALKKTETTDVATYDPSVLGAVTDVTADDISIGRLAVMSSNSNLVKDEKARQGAIVDLETAEELGYKDETPVEFVILKSYKYWIDKRGDDFVAKYPAISPNEKPWEEGDIKRVFHHAFLVLLPNQCETGTELPYEIAFRSTDLPTAKKISKSLMALGRQNMASWNKVFKLTTKVKQNGKHSWYGTDVAVGDDASDSVRAAAYNWFMQLGSMDLNATTKRDEPKYADDNGKF
jgi:hypothetical protein